MATTINNKSLFSTSIAAFLFMVICSSILASSIPQQSSVKSLFVNDEPLVLELNGDDGDWTIETQPDRILFLSFPDTESSEALKNSLTIYDGMDQVDHSPSLLFPSVIEDFVMGKEILQHRFYSTGHTVNIRFRRSDALLKTPSIKYQLKIQKAVTCPINLGGSSSCGRVVDDVSCYCATFVNRNWADTKTFCLNNKMTFLRVDGYDEDLAVYRAFGGQQHMWIGASDVAKEGNWIWDNGGRPLVPGYVNWGGGGPSDIGNEDCLQYWENVFTWNDRLCSTLMGGICEAQP